MAILKFRDKATGCKADGSKIDDRTVDTGNGDKVVLDRRSANADRRVKPYDPNYLGPSRRYSIERRDAATDANGIVVNKHIDDGDFADLRTCLMIVDEEKK